jgi:hypothetical protein
MFISKEWDRKTTAICHFLLQTRSIWQDEKCLDWSRWRLQLTQDEMRYSSPQDGARCIIDPTGGSCSHWRRDLLTSGRRKWAETEAKKRVSKINISRRTDTIRGRHNLQGHWSYHDSHCQLLDISCSWGGREMKHVTELFTKLWLQHRTTMCG